MQIDEPMQEEQPAQEESSKEQDARVEQEEQPAQEKSIKEQATRVDIDLAKKGKSLNELLALMDAYSPVIPDTVTDVCSRSFHLIVLVLSREIRI
jgi:hypothetical protein